uniref:Uncharacterized protein n=1 Tax=Arundo donax TaxID=35708 RepID=A0A0A9AQM2_ARUDO
MSIHLGNQV